MKHLATGLVLAAVLAPALAMAQPAAPADRAGDLRTESRRYARTGGPDVEAIEGWLAVPENRAKPHSRRIEIHFVRLLATGPRPGAPVFFLAGGPGNTGTGALGSPEAVAAWAGFLGHADVVLVDQRGTRDPDLAWRWDGAFPERFFVDAAAARAHAMEASRRAVAAITKRGVDLAGYTTEESVADLEDLREALGAAKVSLVGFSYGTHLALAYLRRHEDRIESAVLAGVEGPDQTLKPPLAMDTHFRRLAALVARDGAIGPAVPDLVALLDRAEQRLARQPMRVPVRLPGGGSREVAVGPFGLRLVLRADIGDATDLPVVPRLLRSVAQGDSSVLAWFVQKRLGFALGVPGMGMMTDASSGASPERLALVAAQARRSRFADVVNFPFPEVTPVWNPPAPPADYHQPVVSGVRTLFVSGEYDWNSPPYQAEEARWGFARATHLVVANAGHEQTLWNPEAAPVVLRFLEGHDVGADRITYPALRFVPLAGESRAHPAVAGR